MKKQLSFPCLRACLIGLLLLAGSPSQSQTGNTGIGTNDPQAKLHVNGDLKLENGVAVNSFSTDSLLSSNSHRLIPTEKAIRDYLKKGYWAGLDTSQLGENVLVPLGFGQQFLTSPVATDVQGNFAYVVNNLSNSLVLFDITDKQAPLIRSITTANLDGPTDIDVQGNYAYVTSETNNRLCIFDVSNPGNPVAVSFVGGSLRAPHLVRASGNLVFVASRLSNSIRVVDVTNPALPVERGFINIGQLDDFIVRGNLIYGCNSGSNRLSVVDVSNPDALVLRSHYSTGMNSARSLYVNGNYAYVTLGTTARIRIVDVSNPDLMNGVATINADVNMSSRIRGEGKYFFVSGYSNGILVYDLTNPVSPVYKGVNSTNLSGVGYFTVFGEYLAVPSYNNNRICLFKLDKSRQVNFNGTGFESSSATWFNKGSNIYNAGNYVGIGVTAPEARLHVEGDSYLVGSVGIGMKYPLAQLGVQGNAYTTGNISIGTSDQVANLTMSNILGPRVALWYNPNGSQYGLGIQSGLLQLYTDGASSDIVFGYGNSTAFTEKMRVKGNGNVGIGINNPSRPLSFPATLEKKISFYPGATGDVGISVSGNDLRLYSDNVNARVSFGYDDYATGFTSRAYVTASGTTALVVQGNMTVNGINYNSDARFKKQIRPLRGSLEKILALQGVQYEMRTSEFPDRNFTAGTEIGLIAQEVEKVLPELVRTDGDGYKSVDYAKLVPVLLEGMKAQQQQLQQQQDLIQSLLKRVEALEKK